MIKVINIYTGDIRYFDDGVDISYYLNTEDYRPMTDIEIENHERIVVPMVFTNLTPIQFDMKLRKHGLLSAVRSYAETDEVMGIAYNRATYFSRTDPFIETARIALNLSNEQVDVMWLSE